MLAIICAHAQYKPFDWLYFVVLAVDMSASFPALCESVGQRPWGSKSNHKQPLTLRSILEITVHGERVVLVFWYPGTLVLLQRGGYLL